MLTSLINSRMLDPVHYRALDRLVECVGEELCGTIVRACLENLGITEISTPHQLLKVGDCMIVRGKEASPLHSGTIAMMGRLMRTRAILLGAKV